MLTVDFDRLGVGAGTKVIDVGCGAGRHSFEAYRRGADVIAFDQNAADLNDVDEILEAMASGTPIVASRAGALPEVVGEDGECARLVRPADVDELTRVLGELLDSPLELQRLGANGRQRALDVFSWESVAAQTVAVYKRACERVAAC